MLEPQGPKKLIVPARRGPAIFVLPWFCHRKTVKRQAKWSSPQDFTGHEFPAASLVIPNILQVNDGTGEYFIPSVKYVEQNVPTRRSYARHDTYRVSLVTVVFQATSGELIRCIFCHPRAYTEIFQAGERLPHAPVRSKRISSRKDRTSSSGRSSLEIETSEIVGWNRWLNRETGYLSVSQSRSSEGWNWRWNVTEYRAGNVAIVDCYYRESTVVTIYRHCQRVKFNGY